MLISRFSFKVSDQHLQTQYKESLITENQAIHHFRRTMKIVLKENKFCTMYCFTRLKAEAFPM